MEERGFGIGFLRMRIGIEIKRALIEGFSIPRKSKARI